MEVVFIEFTHEQNIYLSYICYGLILFDKIFRVNSILFYEG